MGGLGQRRKYWSVRTEEKEWECSDRRESMEVFGQRGKYGSVRTEEKVWTVWTEEKYGSI